MTCATCHRALCECSDWAWAGSPLLSVGMSHFHAAIGSASITRVSAGKRGRFSRRFNSIRLQPSDTIRGAKASPVVVDEFVSPPVSASPAWIIRERRAAIELHALQTGKQEQCLKVIHPNLPNGAVLSRLILAANRIRAVLAIKYKLASEYLIRVFKRDRGSADGKLAVNPARFFHFRASVACATRVTVAEGEGLASLSPDGSGASEVRHG